MKLKLKGGVKGLLLEHGEKAIFGLGVLCFLLFAYGVLGRETLPLDKQPERLRDEVQTAKARVASSAWDANREGLAVANYLDRAKRDDVVGSVYAIRPFDFVLVDLKKKRPEPRALAITELRTNAGLGAFALKGKRIAPKAAAQAAPAAQPKPPRRKKPPVLDDLDPAPAAAADEDGGVVDPDMLPKGGVAGVPAEAEIKRQSWAVVTGLVPIKQQFAEFEQTFKDTIPVNEGKDDKARDTPSYRRFQVERAVIAEGADSADDKNLTWEPISLKDTIMFFRQWAVIAPDVVGRDYTDPTFTMPLGPLLLFDWDAESVAHEPEIPLAAKEEQEQNVLAAQQAQVQNEEAPEEDVPFGAGGQKDKAPAAIARPDVKREEKKVVEFRLFRFFDFNVEPGKRYRYRAKLSIKNPNYNLADKFLNNVASKKNELLETGWSKPSPVVAIPDGNELMASSIVPIKPGGNRETMIKVKLVTIEPATGLPAVLEEDVVRGSVLNFVKTIQVANPVTRRNEKHEVNFETNSVVLDIRGGRPLPVKDKIAEPGEVLLLDGEMNLRAHNEIDDLDLYDEYPVPGAKSSDKSEPKINKGTKKGSPNDLLDGAGAAPVKKKARRARRSSG